MKHKAIFKLYPSVKTIRGDVAYDANENVVEYDEALVNTEAQKMEYITHRSFAYPSIQDQLDMIWHDQDDGTTNWFNAISAVKNQFPKP